MSTYQKIMEKISSKHILLIDDDEVTNMINEKLITKIYNFKVTAFTDANEPLLNFKSGQYSSIADPPRLIFLDINMPQMDGWEFIEEFEKLPEEIRKNCSVVMLTSSIDTSDLEKAKNYPSVTEFISKPLTKDKLKLLEAA